MITSPLSHKHDLSPCQVNLRANISVMLRGRTPAYAIGDPMVPFPTDSGLLTDQTIDPISKGEWEGEWEGVTWSVYARVWYGMCVCEGSWLKE